MTEGDRQNVIDDETLASLRPVAYSKGALRGATMTAHPQFDFERGKVLTVATAFGVTGLVSVYEHSPAIRERRIVGPWRTKGYIDHFDWHPQAGTRLVVIDRSNGALREHVTDAFFAFHTVNAFESGDTTVLDLLAYPTADIVFALLVERTSASRTPPRVFPRRNGVAPSRRVSSRSWSNPRRAGCSRTTQRLQPRVSSPKAYPSRTGLRFRPMVARFSRARPAAIASGRSTATRRPSTCEPALRRQEYCWESAGLPGQSAARQERPHWVGLFKPRNPKADDLAAKPFLRSILLRLPRALWPIPASYGHIFAIDEEGHVLEDLQDPNASYPETTGATETADRLYVHSLSAKSIGWLPR